MRINTDKQFTHDTNFAAQSVRMTVDENNMQHIMSVLTDLYSDPMMAVIREYSSNALDSHIAAGNPDPIEVNLPGPLRRDFEVRDHGVGLSVDDLVNIYSKYGYSTKRDNDNESGMLGLGCKAGLTYTDQFSLTAVKDGVKAIAVVARGEDGAGVINIVDTLKTNEPNGVSIKVPVSDSHFFNGRAKEFFRFWEPGTVLVDGEEPKPIEGLQVTKDIVVVPNHNLNSDYVVMGNIAYRVDRRLSMNLPYGYNVVASVTMGDVNFTPNREALHYTPRTEATLDRINREVKEGVQKSAQAEVEKAKTHYDAMHAAQHWSRLTRGSWFKYKGKEIPRQFNVRHWNYNLRAHRYAVSNYMSVDVTHVSDALQVVGFENADVSGTVRRKTREYIEENDLNVRYVLYTKERIGGEWTEGLPVVDYSEIKAIKLNKGPRASGPGVGAPIRCITKDGVAFHPVDQIPGNKFVVYSPAQELSTGSLRVIFEDATLVELAKNRWDKFMRENKNAASVDDIIADAVNNIFDSLTMRERMEVSGQVYRLNNLQRLDPERVDDPELKEVVEALKEKVDTTRVQRYRHAVSVMRDLIVRPDYPAMPSTEILDKYPLLRYADGEVDKDHLYEYVNAFYEKETR